MARITVALMGNQNCGKTTLFNALTKSRQYVGNWPGVTVDKVVGKSQEYDWKVVDLPGLYSLSAYSPEEIVTRDYLVKGEYDVILNVIDGAHLERSLSLTLELLTFNKPMVVAINMMDVVKKKGISISIEKLKQSLGVEVIDISAASKQGFDTLQKAVDEAKAPQDPFLALSECKAKLLDLASLIEGDYSDPAKVFIAQALLQEDEIYKAQYADKKELTSKVEELKSKFKNQFKVEALSYFATFRYQLIDDLIQKVQSQKRSSYITQAIDKVVLNRVLALPIFLIVVSLVYFGAMYFTSYLELIPFIEDGETSYLTITDYVNDAIFGGFISDGASLLTESLNAPLWLQSLVVDGVVGGVGAVIGFLPQIAFLFFFLSILEQSGYMTRVAFMLDKIFRQFGLSGRNFIPLVISTGCGVPGLMAHSTIDNINEKRIGLITTTFIPCSAKLPIMTMIFVSVFSESWWIAPLVYLMSILSIVCTGVILKKFQAFKEEVSPFVMELPDYHLPNLINTLKTVYQRCRAFVVKAGTIIFGVVVAVWFLSSFGFENNSFGMIENVDNSLLAAIGSVIAILFIPVGFGSWQAAVAVFNGLLAKENVVGTLAVVLGLDGEFEGGEEALSEALVKYFSSINEVTPSQTLVGLIALSFLSFNLWSTPCIAALGAMKRQLGSTKWWLFAIAYMTLWSYSLALIIFRLGGFIAGVLPFDLYTVVAIVVLATILLLLFRKESKQKISINIPTKIV